MRVSLIFVLILALSAAGCAHSPSREFETSLTEGRCDEALRHLDFKSDRTTIVAQANRAAGKTLSYAATGAGYGADVVLTVVGGAVIFVALCGPMMAAMFATQAASGQTQATGNMRCLDGDLHAINFPHNGADVYRDTADWRCPDLTPMARALRRVATCHESKGGEENLRKASQTMHALTANFELMQCVAEAERESIRTETYRLDSLLPQARAASDL